jgi:ABC-type lipoprotein export system ATPase subunit
VLDGRISPLPEVAVALDGVLRVFKSGSTEVAAVRDVTLEISRGECVAVIGPSGSGKSTLLQLIGGLDRPSHGRIELFGQDLGALSESQLTKFRASHIGFVFQDPYLLPGLTALENVMVARIPFDDRARLESAGRLLLDSVGLSLRLDHPPARLSGGERQRVGIARALIGRPLLLLADEPTGNLDADSTEEILSVLASIRQERELTMVIATHDPAVAATATRIVGLRGGTVERDERIDDDQTPNNVTLSSAL